MKGNPAVPGGPLTSKPTRFSTVGCSTASAFLFPAVREDDPGGAPRSLRRRRHRWPGCPITVVNAGESDVQQQYQDDKAKPQKREGHARKMSTHSESANPDLRPG